MGFMSRGRWSSRVGEERADGVDFPPEIGDVLFALSSVAAEYVGVCDLRRRCLVEKRCLEFPGYC